jgi:hypothetical protein
VKSRAYDRDPAIRPRRVGKRFDQLPADDLRVFENFGLYRRTNKVGGRQRTSAWVWHGHVDIGKSGLGEASDIDQLTILASDCFDMR